MLFPQIFLLIYLKGTTVKARMKMGFFFLASDHHFWSSSHVITTRVFSNDEMGTETPKAILFL